jgi:hypothetical protein
MQLVENPVGLEISSELNAAYVWINRPELKIIFLVMFAALFWIRV